MLRAMQGASAHEMSFGADRPVDVVRRRYGPILAKAPAAARQILRRVCRF